MVINYSDVLLVYLESDTYNSPNCLPYEQIAWALTANYYTLVADLITKAAYYKYLYVKDPS